MKLLRRRVVVSMFAIIAVAAALTGCASNTTAVPGTVGTADGIVTISGSITDADAATLEQSWAGWEKANHITIKYTGSKNFEEQIGTAAQQGNAPDLAIFEQPGLIGDLAQLGYLQKTPASVQKNVAANFPTDWAKYTTFNGTDYAAPLLATLKGWVFYSPKQFAAWGVSTPDTWQHLWVLTQQIQLATGKPVWCDGFSSGDSSGAAGTDWIEDLVLREDGPDIYDQWVSHDIPFSDPRIQVAFDDADSLLLDKSYVNAGLGGPKTINTSSEADVAGALEAGTCAMTHQASDFVANLKTSGGVPATIGPHGDFWAFMLPPVSTATTPVTGGGDFVAAFSNDADTVKVQEYLSSDAWAKSRVALGGVISPDKNLSPTSASSPLLQASSKLLQSPKTTFRFDASDLMPSIVGSGSFWTGMLDWASGTPAPKVLSTIDASWPSER